MNSQRESFDTRTQAKKTFWQILAHLKDFLKLFVAKLQPARTRSLDGVFERLFFKHMSYKT